MVNGKITRRRRCITNSIIQFRPMRVPFIYFANRVAKSIPFGDYEPARALASLQKRRGRRKKALNSCCFSNQMSLVSLGCYTSRSLFWQAVRSHFTNQPRIDSCNLPEGESSKDFKVLEGWSSLPSRQGDSKTSSLHSQQRYMGIRSYRNACN